MEKEKVKERLSKRYFGKEVKIYESERLKDIRDKDVFEKEVKIVKDFLKKSNKGKLLDVACGTGRVFPYYGNREVYGIDISEDMLAIAKKRLSSAKLKVSSADKIPFEDNYFSVVITSRFIMHTPDYEKVIKEMIRVTKRGGSIIIDFPNKYSLSYFTTKKRLSSKKGNLKYFNQFSIKEIKEIAEKNNLEIKEIKAKTFFPAKILPKNFHKMTRILNNWFTAIFPKLSTPIYVHFIKN
jgi:ubiquinone/menaquinone biosynthesis C-methylase UbiE